MSNNTYKEQNYSLDSVKALFEDCLDKREQRQVALYCGVEPEELFDKVSLKRINAEVIQIIRG